MFNLKLIKATGIYTILGFIPLVSSFLLLPINTKFLSSADYGVVTLSSVTESYLVLFTIFGLHNAITVFYFDYERDKDTSNANKLLSTTLILILFVSFIFGAILFFLGDHIFQLVWEGSLPFEKYGWFIYLNSIFLSLNQVLFQYYRIKEDIYKAAMVTLLPFVFTTLGGIIGVVFLKLGAYGNIAGKSIGFVSISIPFYLFVFKKYGLTVDFRKIKPMYFYSFPIVLYTLIGTVAETIDKFIINKYFELSQLGIYNLAFTVVSPIAILVMSYWNAVNPTMYRLLATDPEKSEDLVGYFDGVILSTLIPMWGLIIVVEPVIKLFANYTYHDAINLVPLLTLFTIGRAYYLIYSFNLFYYKKTKYLPLINIGSLLVGGISALVLVNYMGIWGICLSVVLGKFSQAFFAYLIERKLSFKLYDITRKSILIYYTLFAIGLNYLILYKIAPSLIVNIVEGGVFFCILIGKYWDFLKSFKVVSLGKN
jgi:O-antigen/teichoic acid export membrane protein